MARITISLTGGIETARLNAGDRWRAEKAMLRRRARQLTKGRVLAPDSG